MKFSCEKALLQSAINTAARAVASKSSIPALEGLLLEARNGYLTVSAQKGLDKDEEDKKGRVLRQERYAGACSRSFYVGDVKAEDVKAKYESGVLTVLIPKKEPKKIVSGTSVIVE